MVDLGRYTQLILSEYVLQMVLAEHLNLHLHDSCKYFLKCCLLESFMTPSLQELTSMCNTVAVKVG